MTEITFAHHPRIAEMEPADGTLRADAVTGRDPRTTLDVVVGDIDLRGMGGPLTPELVLAVAQLRLQRYDDRISQLTLEIESVDREMADLSRKRSALHAIGKQEPLGGADGILLNPTAANERHDDLVRWEGRDRTVAEILSEVGVQIKGDGRKILGPQIENAIKELDERAREVNTGMELRTLELQQLVHRRSEVVSMASELLRSLSDSEKSIIKNLG